MKGGKALFGLTTVELLPLVLLAATVLFYSMVVRPTEQNLQNVERMLAQRTAALKGAPADPRTTDAAQQLAAFYAFFDQKLTFTDWLARFYGVAMRTGVDTHQAEYKRIPREDAPMVLYEVALPVTGNYGNLRAFMEGVLSTIPVVSLDRVTLRRQKTTSEQVDAELRFTFYVLAIGALE